MYVEKNILTTILNRNFEGLISYLYKKVTSTNDKLYLSKVVKLYKIGKLDDKTKDFLYNKIKNYFEKTNDIEGIYINHPDKTFFEDYIKEKDIKLKAESELQELKEIKEVVSEQKNILEDFKDEIQQLKSISKNENQKSLENTNNTPIIKTNTNTKEILTYSAISFLFGLTLSIIIKTNK